MRARGAILAALGALCALALARGGWWRSESPVPVGAGAVTAPALASSGVAPVPDAGADDLGPLPASLRGTEPAGGLRVDAAGHFLPGREALDLFDYYFTASGEEPEATIRARILAEIRRRLPDAAAREAEAFFAQYLAYRDKAAELNEVEPASDDLERRLQLVRELRREVFGPGLARDLFAEEEQITEIDLERRRVALDRELSLEERTRRLAALDASLPAAEREARLQARQAIDLRAAELALRARGASAAEIQAERERRVGPEAAKRLAALDQRREDFGARVAAYRAERSALRARAASDAAFEAELDALRAQRFEGTERIRIEALDRIETGGDGTGGDGVE